ncbi:MAG TPA: YbfB/YjiJ family MFS transporter [Burkholderiales bacterium]|nr:YbfB/YjiJ family MFS transporter [Burkholderiales bacterium]
MSDDEAARPVNARDDPRLARALFAGMCALAIAMGVGRFAYTPLLPAMEQAGHFGADVAGRLAGVNYLGYLLGAFGAAALTRPRLRRPGLFACLAASVATTAAMAVSTNLAYWVLLRFVSGVASAGVLVWSSALILERLARHGRQSWMGWIYAGIGVGIAASGAIIAAGGDALGWRGGWLALALPCCALLVPCWLWLAPSESEGAAVVAPGRPVRAERFPAPLLNLVYFLQGGGYAVTGTFLVAIAKAMPELHTLAQALWIVVGLAAAPSAVAWTALSRRTGLVAALIAAYVVQAIAIVLPVASGTPWAALVASIGFGGTFAGIAVMTVSLGGAIAPRNPTRMIGLLTAAFSIGQIVGPVLAGELAAHEGNFVLALELAAAAVFVGAVLMGVGAGWRRKG